MDLQYSQSPGTYVELVIETAFLPYPHDFPSQPGLVFLKEPAGDNCFPALVFQPLIEISVESLVFLGLFIHLH